MIDVEKILTDFCREYHLNIHFSADMPKGYETANGTFDITKNTLFFNTAMLAEAPNYEVLFYLFHELRHALQYTCPQLFSEVLRLSLDYELMYDGTCYKKVEGDWVECKLEGTEEYLSNAYLGQPYEEDANHFAYEQVKRMLGTSKDLDELYSFWIPKKDFLMVNILDYIKKSIPKFAIRSVQNQMKKTKLREKCNCNTHFPVCP